jgi:hypothetical protein
LRGDDLPVPASPHYARGFRVHSRIDEGLNMQGGFASVKVLGFIVWCGFAAYRYIALEDSAYRAPFVIIIGVVSAALLSFEFLYLPD